MSNSNSNFKPRTTEEKKAFGKQFSAKEKMSYRKGQRSAYSHISNTARRQSVFVGSNIKSDTPLAKPSKAKGK